MPTPNSHRDEAEVTIAIFTKPWVTNCFSKIALVIIRENKTKTKICDSETSTNLAAILKSEKSHHLAVSLLILVAYAFGPTPSKSLWALATRYKSIPAFQLRFCKYSSGV